MRSCLGLLFSLIILTAVIAGGMLLWHLSSTSSFKVKPVPAAPAR